MPEHETTPEEQQEIDDFLNHPTIKNTDIVHYRDDEATHLNTDWLYTDLNRSLTANTVVTWIRLLTGPENTPAGVVDIESVRRYVDRDEPVFETALDELEAIGAIERVEDRITFPNLIWGTPPEGDDEDD